MDRKQHEASGKKREVLKRSGIGKDKRSSLGDKRGS